MSFGGAKDGKHYWLTPEELMDKLDREFHFDFDPCPYPKPEDFDGLAAEWGQSNYVNPPFGAIVYSDGKKRGATAWARKCIEEFKKGKKVVMVYPIDKWVLMLLGAGAKVRNLGDVKWEATEDRKAHKGTGRHIAMFVLDPRRADETESQHEAAMVIMQLQGANEQMAAELATLRGVKEALDEARLIIQCAETVNKNVWEDFRSGAWQTDSPFQKRIDAFLDKYGRFPTEAHHE